MTGTDLYVNKPHCTAAAQCGLFTHKSVPFIFEPPCICCLLVVLSCCRTMQRSWLTVGKAPLAQTPINYSINSTSFSDTNSEPMIVINQITTN